MTSAVIKVCNKKGEFIDGRALLDTCSTANFITEKFANQLNLPMQPCAIPIGTISQLSAISKNAIHLNFRSKYSNFEKTLTFLTVPKIADLIPSERFPRETINIPHNIKLADPEFHRPRSIDLLIGSGPTLSMLCVGQINLSRDNEEFYLQKTLLGWIAAGNTSLTKPPKKIICKLTNLEKLVTRFWEIEGIFDMSPKSQEEIECENHFTKSYRRTDSGRYVVRLPFKDRLKDLGSSHNAAKKRFLLLEKRLNSNSNLKTEYSKVIQEYIELGHLSLVKDRREEGFYLPHHAVIKETSDTTKLRVVFDASAKSDTGISLNDVLMNGAKIQDKLFAHLIRFRSYQYVMTADIEKMYRQILIHEQDRKYQRILWRDGNTINTYELNTVTFGIKSSPFLAIRTLQQLAEDEREKFPTASNIIKSHIYVDDLMTGANSIEEALAIQNDVITILKLGQFHIRQWASNDERLVINLDDKNVNARLLLDKDCELKALGVHWNPKDDNVFYSVKPMQRGERVTKRITKRIILSEISKIFDPLGMLGPVILYAKKLIQDMWQCKLDWDESVTNSIYTKWEEFVAEFTLLNELSFSRFLFNFDYTNVEVHGFCDASLIGYGACIYAKSINSNNEISVRLICAKSGVAPLNKKGKKVTIPRLELSSARLLARLYTDVSQAIDINFANKYLWSDSTIALHWIKTAPERLQMFVANRVMEIQNKTDFKLWRHVSTTENPADALSRGQLPNAFLRNELWFEGPPWLKQNKDSYPDSQPTLNEIPELKKTICFVTTTVDISILQRFSSWVRLVRVMAYCLRLLPVNKYKGTLCIEEIQETEVKLLRLTQSIYLAKEIHFVKNKEPKATKCANLDPFIDEGGLLRVGGRLEKAAITFEQKHPILLPNNNFITDMIIADIHKQNNHAGIQTTLYLLRNKFWVMDGRNQVRRIIKRCITCFRFRAKTVEYKMGNLPQMRVNQTRVFSVVGLDFCGPFFIKEKKCRNRGRVKVYVCVFICMVIKAVHLEVVSDLTTDGFLAALRRFVSRRGFPFHIYSDNATNLVGANNQLSELYELFESETHKEKVNRFATQKGLKWHFIPPISPFVGGLWESTVKIYKHHFKRVVGEQLFTYEEFSTFTTEIEGILNSRPLTPISNDPNDLLVLTPAHYLIGESLVALPERDFSAVPDNRLAVWERICKIRQHFWKRWSLEYLNELQQRHKWTQDSKNIAEGTVVLIKDKNLPCMQWSLGRIMKNLPGDDGIVRFAIVKTAISELKRPVRLLCPLPIDN